jgi:hypothetical protein
LGYRGFSGDFLKVSDANDIKINNEVIQ